MCAADNGNGNDNGQGQNQDTKPDGKGDVIKQNPGQAHTSRTSGGNGISYHGGPIITGGVSIYYIWYGNWGTNTAPSILSDLASNIGGSPYFNINTTYYNGSNVHA